MKKGQFISDGIGLISGFTLSNPEGDILSGVTTMLNTSPIISQGAADDIAKMIAGLVVTVLSRWIFSLIENRKNKKPQVETTQDLEQNTSSNKSKTEN